MNIIPRRLIRQDLDLVDVFVEDTENEFIVVKDLPDVFSQGRNTFKIFGSEFLKEGVKLKIEILDRLGNTIFVNPIKYRLNQYGLPTLPYSYVSVEVYRPPINVGGAATLSILAELDEDKVPFNIPINFIGRYNVRYQTKINIDVAKVVNTSPILFYKKPIITAQEVVKKRLIAPGTITAATVTVSGSGLTGLSTRATTPDRYYPNPQNTTTTSTGTTQKDTAANVNLQEDVSDLKDGPGGNITEILNKKEFKTGEERVPSQFARISSPRLVLSEEPPVMKIRATGSGTFNSKMVGGEIRIPKESITVFAPKQFIGEGNVGIGTGFGSFPSALDLAGGDTNLENAAVFISDYTGSIEKVVNDKEVHVKEPFYFRYGPGGNEQAKYYLADFGNHPYAPPGVQGPPRANFTMSFVDNVVATTSSFAFDSFVDLTIKNARTFSGDVYRVRVSGGSMTRISDFPVLLETVLESPQLLVDTTSPSGVKRTGYFQSQTHIDKYWNTQFNITSSYDNTKFIDSVKLSGSFGGINENGSFSLDKAQTKFTVDKDVVYELSFRVFGKKGPKKQSDGTTKKEAKIFFHVSGSNIADDNNPKYANIDSYGTTIRDENGNKVGLFLGDSDPDELNYEKISHAFTIPFKLDRISNDDTVIKLRVESGEWIIQDISLRPALDTGFSPDQFKIRVPIPINTQRPDRFRFILNYYTQDNVEAEEISEIKDVEVQGEALLIQGDDNLLKGTVTIGNVQGAGIEMKGGNSAFIRSVPYKGFISASQHGVGGFFMWSGSVSPGGVSADNYRGSGLEIHDGNTGTNESFFKFRTIDASNDNSSSFDVRASRFFLGSETAGNFISGSVGNIKIQAKGETLISGSQVTVAAPTFFLGGQSQFVSGSGGNIEISSSNFHLQNDGDVVMQGTITAEAGGTIGGFSIGSDNLTATNFVLNTTNKSLSLGSGNSIFIADADTGIQLGHATFSSAPFRVTPAGALSATSGDIGGFTISSTALTGGSSGTTVALTPGTGLHLGNASFGSAPFSVTNAGVIKATSGTIGGFTLTSNAISSSNLLIEDSGEIKTSNFATRLQGFRISAKGNGTAEFENVRIRGTLKTSVFEKETVNAVGGRLYVANSTVLSSSISSSQTALKVENASGFEVGEILFAKKVTGTGFTKEFMKITSISRQDPEDDTDFTGFLHVERGFGGPRTGSAITDTGTDLNGAITKIQTSLTVDGNDARLLDKRMIKIDDELMMVSGSPSATILQVHRGVDGSTKATHANNASVFVLDKDSAFLFGLVSPSEDYTEGQVLVSTGRYISGDAPNTVGSGYIELNANPTTGATPFIEMVERTGSNIYDMERRLVIGDLSGFVGSSIGNRVDLPDNPGFGLASENVFLSGGIKANSGSIGGIKMVSNKIFTGNAGGVHGNSNTGFFANSSGDFSLSNKFIFTNSTGNLSLSGSQVTMKTNDFFFGNQSNFISGSSDGNLKIQNTGTTTISGSAVTIETNKFFFGKAGSQFVSGSNDLLEISSSRFHLQPGGDTIMQGKITATSGEIGGFDISANEISSSGMSMDSANQVLIFKDVDGSTLGTAGQEALRISFDGSAVVPSGNTTTTGERARIHVPSGSLAASDLVINTEVLNNVRIVPGRLRCFRKDGSGLPSDGNGKSILNPTNLGNNFNKHLDAAAYFPNSNIDGDFSTLDFNLGVLGYASRGTNSSTSRQVALYGLSNVGAGAISIYGEVLQENGGYSGVFHGGQFVVGDVIGTGGSGADSTTDSDFVFVAYPNDIDGGTYSSYKGRVGINKRLPASALDVNGTISSSIVVVESGTENAPSIQIGSTNDGFYHLASGDSGINVLVNNVQEFLFADGGGFHADADITAFSTTVDSDIRLKENIKPLENNLEKILQLKPSSFRWKIQDRENDIGLIAQDVEKVIPELVKEKSSIGKTKEFLDGDKHKTVDYSKLTTFLIGAVQEQQKQIDELKKKLEEL